MTDFGFGAILERIERDFGKGWAKALTVVVAVGMLAACLSLVGNLISSAALWFSGITSETTWWAKLVLVGKYVFGFLVLVVLANNLVTAAITKSYAKQAARQFHDIDIIRDDAVHMLESQRDDIEEFRGLVLKLANVSSDLEIANELRAMAAKIGSRRPPADAQSSPEPSRAP